jgi:hypothetical protein
MIYNVNHPTTRVFPRKMARIIDDSTPEEGTRIMWVEVITSLY